MNTWTDFNFNSLIRVLRSKSANDENHRNDLKKRRRQSLFHRRMQYFYGNDTCRKDIMSNCSIPDSINSENSENSSKFYCFGSMLRFLKRKFTKNSSSKRAKHTKFDDEVSVSSEERVDISETLPSPEVEPRSESVNKLVDSERERIVSNTNQIDWSEWEVRNWGRHYRLDTYYGEPPDEILDDPELLKYWLKRYRLFSKYDKGIQLDRESWYSVTPEKISIGIAERCRSDVIIDAFCGAGGNTIQFAFTCERVIAIDKDYRKILMARHNAKIYGVHERIEFIHGDFFKLVPYMKADVVFLSPPWGGPKYSKMREFPLSCVFEPHGGKKLFDIARKVTSDIAFYLPRNINIPEVTRLQEGYVKIDRHYLEKKLVAITAYFGELVEDYDD